MCADLDAEFRNVWNDTDLECISANETIWGLFFQIETWSLRRFDSTLSCLGLAFPWSRMRGDRRCSSFRKEKPAGLTRALSWLSVPTLSRQSRRIFHSQNELHAVHNHQTHSHTHLYAREREEKEDDDNWVYQPQHKIGEGARRRENQQCHSLFILVATTPVCSCTLTRPCGIFFLAPSQFVTMPRPHLNGFLFLHSTRKPMNNFVYMHKQSKKWVAVFSWPLVFLQ